MNAHTEAAPSYGWWEAALAGSPGPIHPDSPQVGFYRAPRRDGGWDAVAIWHDEITDSLRALRGGEPVDPLTIWTWCCAHPVSEEAYRQAAEGGDWPDEAPGLGHNRPPEVDPHAPLPERIKAVAALAAEFLEMPIGSRDRADQAAHYVVELLSLKGDAEDARKAQLAPLNESVKAVRAQWGAPIEEAEAAVAKLRAALTDYMLASGFDRVGAKRRAVTLKTVTQAAVVDPAKALAHFADHAEVQAVVAKLAAAAARAGESVPGVIVTQERKAV